jgi:hypothetical protein
MKFVNLTPHTVNLINPSTEVKLASFPSEGSVRVGTENNYHVKNGVPIGTVQFTELEGLPEPQENTMYILSLIAFNAAKEKGRKDICFPSGQMFRNEQGQIIGMEFLATDN